MFCNKCGEKINDNASVCEKCGCALNQGETKASGGLRWLKLILPLVFFILIGIGAYTLYINSEWRLISSVKGGSFVNDTEFTIGEIFSEKAGLKNVQWSCGITKKGLKIVQIVAETPNGKTQMTTQFEVGENGRFRIYAMEEKNLQTSESIPLGTIPQALIVKTLQGNLKHDSVDNSVALFAQQKEKGLNSGRAIAQAWNKTARGERSRSVGADTIYDWAFILAQRTDLNDSNVWILDFDPKVQEKLKSGGKIPTNIGNKTGSNWKITENFKMFPLSWEVANLVTPNAPGNSPIAWTRGLTNTGKWSSANGVYGDKGGFVVFADGSVKWFDALRDDDNPRGVLKRYAETMPTFEIGSAIRGGSKNILKSE